MLKQEKSKRYWQVFQEIRNYILLNRMQPGDSLPTEQEFCEMMIVSRNVVREALKAMELMGLVSSVQGRGTVLLPFSTQYYLQNIFFAQLANNDDANIEMLQIRKRLELGFMDEAYDAITDVTIQETRSIYNEMIKQSASPFNVFHPIDRNFHMTIFAPLKNESMMSLLDAIWTIDAICRCEDRTKFGISDVKMHENIVNALEIHNKEAFKAAMQLHYSSYSFATKINEVSIESRSDSRISGIRQPIS